jgi:hypothetical protein
VPVDFCESLGASATRYLNIAVKWVSFNERPTALSVIRHFQYQSHLVLELYLPQVGIHYRDKAPEQQQEPLRQQELTY